MVVDGDGEAFLGLVLSYDVLVEEFFDLPRLGHILHRGGGTLDSLFLLTNDVVTQVDALGADEYPVRAFDKGVDLLLRTPAKATNILLSTV